MAAVTGVMILVTLLLAIEPMADEMLKDERRPATPTKSPTPSTVPPVPEPPMALELATQLVKDLEAEIDRRRRSPVVDEAVIAALEAQRAVLREVAIDAVDRVDRLERSAQRAAEELAAASRAAEHAAQQLAQAKDRFERESLRSRVRFLPGERYDKAPLFVEVRADGCVVGEFDAGGAVAMISDGRGRVASPAELTRLLGPRSPQAHQLVFIVRQDALPAFAVLRDHFYERGWEVGWQLWDAQEGGFFEPPRDGGATP